MEDRTVIADSPYVRDCYSWEDAGGESVAIIMLRDGKAIVLAYDVMAVYASVDAYHDGLSPIVPDLAFGADRNVGRPHAFTIA